MKETFYNNEDCVVIRFSFIRVSSPVGIDASLTPAVIYFFLKSYKYSDSKHFSNSYDNSFQQKMDFENDFYIDASRQSPSDTNYTMSEEQRKGMALFFFVTALSVLFVSICSARHILKSCTHFCCTTIFCGESYVDRNQEQYAEDRVFAESLQRRVNEEERQRERLLKRKERRMWYEYYIKPWTKVSIRKRGGRFWQDAMLDFGRLRILIFKPLC